jgi:hypothetical protein
MAAIAEYSPQSVLIVILASPSIVVIPNRRRLLYLGICHIGPNPSLNIEPTDNPDVPLRQSTTMT